MKTVDNFEVIANWDQSTGALGTDGEVLDTDVITWPTADNTPPKNIVLKMCTPADIDVIVDAECSDDSTRSAVFSVKQLDDCPEDEECPICEVGTAPGQFPPADVSLDCEYSPAGSAAGFLAYILGIVGFGLCIVWMLWVAMNMNNKVIKVAQPVFCIR
jgi:hypothetical protein